MRNLSDLECKVLFFARRCQSATCVGDWSATDIVMAGWPDDKVYTATKLGVSAALLTLVRRGEIVRSGRGRGRYEVM